MPKKTFGYRAGVAWMMLWGVNSVLAWAAFRTFLLVPGDTPLLTFQGAIPPAILGFATGLLLIELSGKGRGMKHGSGRREAGHER